MCGCNCGHTLNMYDFRSFLDLQQNACSLVSSGEDAALQSPVCPFGATPPMLLLTNFCGPSRVATHGNVPGLGARSDLAMEMIHITDLCAAD